MIIPVDVLKKYFFDNFITLRGVLHIGAHECEELPFYRDDLCIDSDKIIWIEALDCKVTDAKKNGIINVFNEVVSDKDNDIVLFNKSNNSSSSSIFSFKTHKTEYPEIVVDTIQAKQTITIDSFLKKNGLISSELNLWNLIIQGAELLALKGGLKSLGQVDVIITKIFVKPLYDGCKMLKESDDFLTQCGFERVLTELTPFGWGEAVYVKKTYIE
jgi:hypothetical protein